MFQFLIGRLKTKLYFSEDFYKKSMFQFLIGRLKTYDFKQYNNYCR